MYRRGRGARIVKNSKEMKDDGQDCRGGREGNTEMKGG